MQRGSPKTLPDRLLWIDGLGGLIAGALVLLVSEWLSQIHGLPKGLVVFVAVTNLVYGTYSTSLARRDRRPMAMILALVAANLAWLVCCMTMAFMQRESITVFGAMHLVGEGLYVGSLAALEWRYRKRLVVRGRSQE